MNKCINCGQEASELHHVVPQALGGNDIDSNKVWLCSKCHALIHGMNIQKRGVEWHSLQAAGIERAKKEGKYKGKQKIEIDWVLFKELYQLWKKKELTAIEMMNRLNLKPNTFYRRVKEYELSLNNGD